MGTGWEANATITGGAAVLAIVFGVGVINYHKDIREVFADYDQYQLVFIEACATYGRLCSDPESKLSATDSDRPSRLALFSLTDYSISAEMAGRPLYVSQEGKSHIALLVFGRDLRDSLQIRLYARRHSPSQNDIVDELEVQFTVADLLDLEGKPDLPQAVAANTTSGPGGAGTAQPVLTGAPASTSANTKGLNCRNMKIPSAGCKLELVLTESRDRLKTVQYALNFGELSGTTTANRGDAAAKKVDANFVAPQIQIQPQ